MENKDIVLDAENKESANKETKETVPMTQFLAALNSANKKYDALAAKFDALQQPVVQQEAKRFTRAELKAAVTAGQVTDDQAEELWIKQVQEDVTANVTRTVLETVGSGTKQERVSTDLSEYKRLAPEILDESSEKRAAIATEYQYLLSIGHKQSLETELVACRSVLGPLEKLKVARSARRDAETHEETGGGGESRQRSSAKTGWDSLTARQKDYYEGQIKNGQYKDKKAVETELDFVAKRKAA